MSQNTEEKEVKASSLKDLNMRLHEIFNVMDETDAKLNYLSRNTPADKATEDQSSKGDIATLEGLHTIVDRIARKSNSMAKSTNVIVGS